MGLAFRGIYFPFRYLALRSSNASPVYFLYGSKKHLLLTYIFVASSREYKFVSFRKGFAPQV